MNENSTSIRYSDVGKAVGTIKEECLPKMRNIFDNFNSTMQRLGGQDVYVGDASETFQARYNKLSQRFVEFENLMLRFVHEFEMASQSTSQTEQKLSQEAQNLNSGN